MSNNFIFTSESDTQGHPDKLCDQVSDAVVDHFLIEDPDAGVDTECAVASGVMFISAHYASRARVDITDIARRVISDVGYSKDVFDADACTIMTSFIDHTASSDRPLGLDKMDDKDLDRITARHQVHALRVCL